MCPGEAARVRKGAESEHGEKQVRPRWEQRKRPGLGGVEHHSPLEPEAKVALKGTAEKKKNPKARLHDCG